MPPVKLWDASKWAVPQTIPEAPPDGLHDSADPESKRAPKRKAKRKLSERPTDSDSNTPHNAPNTVENASESQRESSSEPKPKPKRTRAKRPRVNPTDPNSPRIQSCDTCRLSKTKCSNFRPPKSTGHEKCTFCAKYDIACEYEYVQRKRGPPQLLMAKIEAIREASAQRETDDVPELPQGGSGQSPSPVSSGLPTSSGDSTHFPSFHTSTQEMDVQPLQPSVSGSTSSLDESPSGPVLPFAHDMTPLPLSPSASGREDLLDQVLSLPTPAPMLRSPSLQPSVPESADCITKPGTTLALSDDWSINYGDFPTTASHPLRPPEPILDAPSYIQPTSADPSNLVVSSSTILPPTHRSQSHTLDKTPSHPSFVTTAGLPFPSPPSVLSSGVVTGAFLIQNDEPLIGHGLDYLLVTRDEIIKILELFFAHLHPLNPCIHKPTFMQDLMDRREERDSDFFALVMSVIASSLVQLPRSYIPSLDQSLVRMLASYCSEASRLVTLAGYKIPNCVHVVIRYLDSIYHFYQGNQATSNACFGEAVSIAVTLRMHEESSYENLDFVESEMRRRVFWILFGADKIMAILWGRPMSLRSGYQRIFGAGRKVPQLAYSEPNFVNKDQTTENTSG